MWSSQDPIPSTGGKHYPQRFSPRREETDLHIGLANLSVLYQEDLIPKTSGFESQQGLHVGEGGRKQRLYFERGHAKSHMI